MYHLVRLVPLLLGQAADTDATQQATDPGWFDLSQLWEKVQEWVTLYGFHFLAAILILVGGRIAAGLIRKVLTKTLTKSKVEQTLVSFTGNMAFVAVMVFAIIAALSMLGVQTASFVAVIGAAGLAVGLALQGSLSNFAAGVLIILFKPFKVGDFIDGGGCEGVVDDIGIFTTTLRTLDNRNVVVPNSKLTTENVVNFTARDTRRVDLVIGVAYDARLDHVKRVLAETVAADERVLAEPATDIGVLELADSSVNFAVRPWVKTGDYWPARFALQEAIKVKLDEEGIGIPFPQRDVHYYEERKAS